MTTAKFYTLADAPCNADLERLEITLADRHDRDIGDWRRPFRPGVVGLVAKRTGETRIPLAGEWYLSGAKPEAYRMPADGVGDYQIVELVLIVGRTIYEEVS